MKKEDLIYFFSLICNIPHISGQTNQLAHYLYDYFTKKGLKTEETGGNILVTVPPTEGYENYDPIILQGHMDMVGIKEKDSNHDFLNDPIEFSVSPDNWITSKKTALGGNDGIAIVYMMQILEDPEFKHPKLYYIITRDAENGNLGAKSLTCDNFQDATLMITIDSEQEGIMTLASAGGEAINQRYQLETAETLGSLFELKVSNLKGGHSASVPNLQSGHAARILAQIAAHLFLICDIRILELECNGIDNAIATEGRVVFSTLVKREDLFNKTYQIGEIVAKGYSQTDQNMIIDLYRVHNATKVQAFTYESTNKIINDILFLPFGVVTSVGPVVTASTSITNCIARDGELKIRQHFRFKNQASRDLLKNLITQFVGLNGGMYYYDSYSNPWDRHISTQLLDLANMVWRNITGYNMKFVEIHGTLENGILQERLPNTNIISLGPTILGTHTPYEKIDISSVIRVYEFLKQFIKDYSHSEIPKELSE